VRKGMAGAAQAFREAQNTKNSSTALLSCRVVRRTVPPHEDANSPQHLRETGRRRMNVRRQPVFARPTPEILRVDKPMVRPPDDVRPNGSGNETCFTVEPAQRFGPESIVPTSSRSVTNAQNSVWFRTATTRHRNFVSTDRTHRKQSEPSRSAVSP
jgi:hypothetical protein